MADQHPSVQHWQPEPGDIVTAAYKTGNYIGRLTQIRPDRGKGVVQILAVLRHPVQGDLHQPGQADVPLFHARKALAYREQCNVPLNHIRPYEGDIADYGESLQQSVQQEIKAMLHEKQTPYIQRSLELLRHLQEEYVRLYPPNTKKSNLSADR